MLFSCKFHDLELRRNSNNTDFFLAHSSTFDKTGILFFMPKDEKLADIVKDLALPQNKERLGDYVFKIAYRSFKGQDGSFKNYFNLVGASPCNTAD